MQNPNAQEPLEQPASLAIDFGLKTVAAPMEAHARKRVSSKTLLGSDREIEIEHGTQLYRLRLTALGKLILTK